MIMFLLDIEYYFLEDLKIAIKDKQYDDITRWLYEIAGQSIPVFYGNLLEIAQYNLWLAVEEPELPIKFAVQAIECNLYDHLVEIGYEYLEEHHRGLL